MKSFIIFFLLSISLIVKGNENDKTCFSDEDCSFGNTCRWIKTRSITMFLNYYIFFIY